MSIGMNGGGHPLRTHNLDIDFFMGSSDTVIEGIVREISDPYTAVEVEGGDPLPANTVTVEVSKDFVGNHKSGTIDFVVLDNSMAIRVEDRMLFISSNHRLGKLRDVNVPFIAARPVAEAWEFQDGQEVLKYSNEEIDALGRDVAQRIKKVSR